MKLLSLRASRYRSLRDETISLSDLNLFIGANSSGKSTILDALSFLHEAVKERDFKAPVSARGNLLDLAWKAEKATDVQFAAEFEENGLNFEWTVTLSRQGASDFSVSEEVREKRAADASSTQLLRAEGGRGWWVSGDKEVRLALDPTGCALAAATVDLSFAARRVAEFVYRWGFFDPSPFCLRLGPAGPDSVRLDPFGRNLPQRLLALQRSWPEAFQNVISATQSVLGLRSRIAVSVSLEPEYRVLLKEHEPGLMFPVHQTGISSGTLRMLALMTVLFGETGSNLIGIEEPENYLHPTALAAFAEYLKQARDRVQILVTTHSPLLLDFLDEPESVCVVRRDAHEGTRVTRESNPAGVRRALEESGFGLGEFHETKGFGG